MSPKLSPGSLTYINGSLLLHLLSGRVYENRIILIGVFTIIAITGVSGLGQVPGGNAAADPASGLSSQYLLQCR